MRLDRIRALRERFAQERQHFHADDISGRIHDRFVLSPREPMRRRLARRVSPLALALQQPFLTAGLRLALPFRHNLVCVGERFGSDASLAALLAGLKGRTPGAVLIPGCYLGSEDVQFWLRRGVGLLEGIDVYSLASRWSEIVPALTRAYGTPVRFRQASVEALPFDDASFDLIASSAVLEHVRNLGAMVDETARVLKPGGWARHDFGPLYHCWGGDHCIAAFGFGAGYDHLLLEDPAYQAQIRRQEVFASLSDPNLPFWALNDQFSFAEPAEYLAQFARRFDVIHVVVKVSEEALRFRAAEPRRWRALMDGGVSEATLLVKSLAVVMRKRDSTGI